MCADKTKDNKAKPLRVCVFVDFWNFTLSLKNKKENFKPDWSLIGRLFAEEAGKLADPNLLVSYEAMHVYGSHDPDMKKADKHLKWFYKVLNRMPGVRAVSKKRRKKKSPPKCPNPECMEKISQCPSCNHDMRGTEEKGVDTSIVTDMIRLAWADAYDVAVLVSSDGDFIPVVEFLQSRGIKIIHASFPPLGHELSQECWDRFEIPKLMPKFRRTK
ncbi:MAG: NYN domain-containing protein [Hyphomicrobiales bacterium]|nr:NYN domain-containing protein [Hyphomicrobiales bacterium]